jgi:hypothetical protein
MILIKKYSTNNILLSNEVLSAFINNFWEENFNPLKKENHFMLMCKIQYSDVELGHRTLGHLRRVNFEDKELFIEYLSERLGILNDAYTTHSISTIIFSYIIKSGKASEHDRRLLSNLEDKTLSTHRFNNMKLPVTMIASEYGQVIISKEIEEGTRYIVTNKKILYQIDVVEGGQINKVKILGASDLEWKDTKLTEGFKREIGKSTIYFINGEIVLRKLQLSAKPFRKTKTDRMFMSSFVTMVAPVSSKDLWKFKRIR